MKDDGWVGKFVNGQQYELERTKSRESMNAEDEAAHKRPLLYDAHGRPLVIDHRAGFVKGK